jgi:hypothetical protein
MDSAINAGYYEKAPYAHLFSKPINELVVKHYTPLLNYFRQNSKRNRYIDIIIAGDRLFLDGNLKLAVSLLRSAATSVPSSHSEPINNIEILINEAELIQSKLK